MIIQNHINMEEYRDKFLKNDKINKNLLVRRDISENNHPNAYSKTKFGNNILKLNEA